ncbi:MAG: hypothetical protein NTW86_25245 [Candidatus Sumerlaeota bacterium]|nr:hypothetical protein [Candidatus Sumerlaeota bacterium]
MKIHRLLMDPPSRGARLFWIGLSLLPALLLVRYVWKYGVDVPFWDQWALIPLLEHDREGTLSFSELWRFHNEHRMLFPKMTMLGLARLTHWNIRAELALIVLLAVGLLCILGYHLFSMEGRLAGVSPWPLLPVFSGMVFSLNQWENWLWGWQINLIMGLVGVVAGLGALAAAVSAPPLRRVALVSLSAICGVIGSYSFGSGLLFWFAAFPLLLCLSARLRRRATVLLWGVWLAVAAAVWLLYFTGDSMSVFGTTRCDAIKALLFGFTFLGSPMLEAHERLPEFHQLWGYSALVGGAGLATLVWALWLLFRWNRGLIRVLAPALSLSCYGLASAFAIGLGRGAAAIALGATPRYIAIGDCFWFGVLALLYGVAAAANPKRNPAVQSAQPQRMAVVLLAVFVGLAAVRSWQAREGFAYRHEVQARGRAALLAWTPGPDLDGLYPDRATMQTLRETLMQYDLSLYRGRGEAASSSPDFRRGARGRQSVKRSPFP